MIDVKTKKKILGQRIGTWYYSYQQLQKTQFEITLYQVYCLMKWIENNNTINDHVIDDKQEILIPEDEVALALIIGKTYNVTNDSVKENCENSFSINLLKKNKDLYKTTHRPGLKNNEDIADDMIWADKSLDYFNSLTDKNGKIIDFKNIIDKKDNPKKLFDIMKSKFRLNTMAGLSDVLNEWINHFSERVVIINNKVDFRKFENKKLTEKIKNHTDTKRVVDKVKGILKNELNSENIYYDIQQLLIKLAENENNNFYKELHWGANNEHDNTPLFNKDNLNGLRILVNDVWGYDVSIEKYSISNNKICGTLKFIFFDNFGLDDEDIEKFGNQFPIAEGFKAWYFLQHYNNYLSKVLPYISSSHKYEEHVYQPFITQATVYEDFEYEIE